MSHESISRAPDTGANLSQAPDCATVRVGLLGALVHLSTLLTSFVGPLLVYLLRESPDDFVAHAAREAINFQLTLALLWILTLIALFFVIGFALLPFLILFSIGMPVWAAALTSRGQRYRYPLCIRWVGRNA